MQKFTAFDLSKFYTTLATSFNHNFLDQLLSDYC